jgi:hypothetical protein
MKLKNEIIFMDTDKYQEVVVISHSYKFRH